MKFSLPSTLLLFALLALPKLIMSQCGSGPCPPGFAQWSQDPNAACVAINEFELDCASGEMPNGGVVVQPPAWCTTVENNIYYAFTASGSSAAFEVAAFNCQGGNGALQAAVLDCNLNFVSNCEGNIPSGAAVVVVGSPLTPGETYYLMLDGSAGSVCDYIINGAIPADPVGMNICVGGPSGNNVGTYTANASGIWTVLPPNAGFITSPNPGSSATVEWQMPGMFQVCISVCPSGAASCLDVEIGENEVLTEGPTQVCLNEQAMCGNTPFFADVPGTWEVVDIQPNGFCETITTCIFEVPEQVIITEEAAICKNDVYEICGITFYDTGLWMEECPGPNGCDDLHIVDLVVQDPTVVIDDPIEVGCGANWMAIINGTGSPSWVDPFVGTTTIMWTGPGPIPNPNEILIEVTVPGEYCLTITHETFGVVCEETGCIDVVQSLTLPDPPDLDGPTSVCGGMETYTVSPVGNTIPDSYTWTTPNGEPYTTSGNFSIIVDWAGSNGGQLCVTANNQCGSSAPTCLTIVVGNGPADPIVVGPDTACDGDVLTYEITNPSPGATCTWTVPPGASFTQAGSIITVDFDGASSGNVCATCMDQCGTTPPTCIAVTVDTPPAAPTFISGPNQVCAAEMATYCVNNDPEATSWSWTSPAGNFPNSTSNCLDIDWTGLNGGNICVTANNDCGSSPQTCFNVAIIASPTAAISGQGEFCAGSGDAIDLTVTLTGVAPWTISYTINGATPAIVVTDIQSSPYTISATEPGTYTLVSVTDGGICAGTVSGSAEVIENPLPTATLSGSGDICMGSGMPVNLTITLTGNGPWDVVYLNGNGNPTNLTINASPFNLPISQANAGTISLVSVIDNNDCEGTVSGTSQVNVIGSPTTTVVTECDATNTEYVVIITISNGDPTSYTVTPATGTLTGNIFTSDPIPSGSGYSFTVDDANNCNPKVVDDNIVVCDCTSAVGEMDQTTLTACGDGPIDAFIYDNTNEVFDGDDVQMYVLHNGNSASIVPPIILISPNASVTFDPAQMTYGTTYYLSAVVGNGGGPQGIDLNDPCLQVAQGTPIVFYEIPTATIAGSTAICVGNSTDLTITLTGVSPWTVTINGTQVSIFDSPYAYTVDPDSTTDYTLTLVSDDNGCTNTASGTETVTVNTSPEVINVMEECNGSGTAYTVTFEIISGDPSCYTVEPAGAGTLTGNVYTSNPIAGGLGYSFEVFDCNGCPSVIVEKPLVDCNCLSEAGNMTADDLDVCGDEIAAVTYEGGEVLDDDDALCFILHSGNAQAPIATNSSAPDFSFDPNTMTIGTQYFICPVVGNDDGSGCVDLSDPCLSIGGCALVTFRVIPTATLTTGDVICEGEIGQLTVEFTGSGPWTFEYTDGAVVNSLDATNSPFTFDVSPAATTDYSLVSVVGKFCDGTVSGAASVSVNQAPEASVLSLDCNSTSTAYTVTIEISGGDAATYDVVPGNGNINGNIFTSNPYMNNETFSFEIDDQFQCGPVVLTGGFNCDCITDAGVMSPTPLNYCLGDEIIAEFTVNPMFDGDDSLVYILHTSSGNSLGTVIATSDEPFFDFDQAVMSTGVTYYVSAVAGNGLPNGNVDLSDFCLSVAPGTPILFNDLPTASISGSATLCLGENTDVSFSVEGVGPFVINYEINGMPQAPQVIPVPGTFDVNVSPTDPVTYTLISVEDQGTGCMDVADGEIEIMVNLPVEAGSQYADFEFCANSATTISLFENLVGFDYGGTWTDANNNILPNGALNTAPLPAGEYFYTYTVFGEAPCPDDEADVKVIIYPAPVADAGVNVDLDCNVTSEQIGGPGTTSGAVYSWEGNVSDPTIPNPTISEAGEFILTVSTTPFVCTDMDTVYAFLSNEQPIPVIEVSDVSCFGMDDGFLIIESISGGQPPYTVSFNGGPFTSDMSFINLGPDSISIIVKDSGGCISPEFTFAIKEPEEVTVDLVPNIEGTPPVAEYNAPFTIEVVSTPPFAEMDTVVWTYSGNFNDSLFCASCPSNEVALEYQTQFNIMVSENGCTDEDQLTVYVSRDHLVYVPNAFSPNGKDDDRNELFKIFVGADTNVEKVRSFLVYSRWGETVYEYYNFHPSNPAIGWDGTHRGELMNPAVFTWTAEVEFEDNVVRRYKGDVSLIR
ncbi:MAG: gliding motility-associated C-terminal domain-containing protein [Saprospiraceae bacterium]